jgi:hypothetical protein
MMSSDGDRLYPIETKGEYHLFSGIRSDSRRVLMGLWCPDLIALYFAEDGTFLDFERRPVVFFQNVKPTYQIYDRRIDELLDNWQREMGFQAALIRVKKFILPEVGISIDDYDSHVLEILDDPKASEEEKDEIREEMQEWDAEGQFVLNWGNDYWLDHTGEIVSS